MSSMYTVVCIHSASCPASILYLIPPFLYPFFSASLLFCIPPYLYFSFLLSRLFCMSPFLHPPFLVFLLSCILFFCIPPFLYPPFLVFLLSCIPPFLYPFLYLSSKQTYKNPIFYHILRVKLIFVQEDFYSLDPDPYPHGG